MLVGIASVEDLVRDVIDSQVEPGVSPAGPEPRARAQGPRRSPPSRRRACRDRQPLLSRGPLRIPTGCAAACRPRRTRPRGRTCVERPRPPAGSPGPPVSRACWTREASAALVSRWIPVRPTHRAHSTNWRRVWRSRSPIERAVRSKSAPSPPPASPRSSRIRERTTLGEVGDPLILSRRPPFATAATGSGSYIASCLSCSSISNERR